MEKATRTATEKAFEAARENSFKCALDPSMHLATVKGTTNVFIGAGLDNVSNQISGQARWLKNDAV